MTAPTPGPAIGMARRHLWLAYLVVSLAAAIWWASGGAPGHLYVVIASASAIAVVVGRRLWRPDGGAGWALFAAGLGSWATADVLWSLLAATGATPFPSIADAAYLVGYLFMLAAIGGVASREVRDREASVDAAIVVAGGAGLIGMALVDAARSADGPWLAKAVAIAYPALSLLLLGGGARLWLSLRSRRPTLALLGVALTVQLVSDAVYAVQSVEGTYAGGLLDLGWLAAYSLLGAASLHPSVKDRPRPRRTDRSSLSTQRLALLASAAFAPLAGHALFGLPIAIAMGITFVLAIACVVRVAGPVEAMRRAATVDDLTGLHTRAAILDVVDDLCHDEQSFVLLCLGIDRFDLVNEALGHVAGDALLDAVGRRVDRCVSGDGVTGRLTGHELVVVLPQGGVAAAEAVAHRVRDALTDPIVICEVEVRPTVSIGIAVATDAQDGAELIRCAHAALANAVGEGGDRIVAADGSEEDAYRRLRLAADLRAGIGRGEITVVFQPEIDLSTGRLFGFEALARWRHPTFGEIQPSAFIPLAEEVGLVHEIFAVVLEAALATQHVWTDTFGTTVPMAVNVSPTQLGPGLVEHVRVALERWQPVEGSVWLELTESTVADRSDVVEVLRALRALGVRIAIDDFGTGHSSVSRLAAVEWDAIKIDRSFVSSLLVDDRAAAVTAATIGMARSLGILTVAEGVETEAQQAELRRLGCDVAQGYLVSRPLEPLAARAIVRAEAAGGRDLLPVLDGPIGVR